MAEYQIFQYKYAFELESGSYLPEFELAYTTLGELNQAKDNVVWVCHALTGNAHPEQWWSGIIGKDKLFDPEKHFIICANVLGGCYGSTGPLSIHPQTLTPYYHSFPQLTNRDMVQAFDLLRKHLKIEKINTLIGGSLGGQQVLEWAILKPAVVKNLIVLAANAWHSPWGIAFNESQRMAIEQDVTWQLSTERAGLQGLKVARSIAMISYRTYQIYNLAQQEEDIEKQDHYKAATYQQYQGFKLAERFNAYTYYLLSKAMDSHHVGRGRGSATEALARIKAKTLVIGIESDILFPIQEQQYLAKHIPNAKLETIFSEYGHDAFLVKTEEITHYIQSYFSDYQLQTMSK